MRAILLLSVALLFSGSVYAQTLPQGNFPGAMNLPHQANSPAQVVKLLFPSGKLRALRGDTCKETCNVRLVAHQTWTDQGQQHMILVTAAELPDNMTSHAESALLGIALLTRQPSGWVLNEGAPNVDMVGSWGKMTGKASIVPAGPWQRGVSVTSGFSGQGVSEEHWHLYLPNWKNSGKFGEALDIPTEQDSSGTGEANPSDFHTKISISATEHDLTVIATKIQGRHTTTKKFHFKE